MAEQIPYGVAVSIINRLASLAFRKFGRIYGVTAELEKLKNTLEFIQAQLLDAEERQDQDRAVKILIRRLKEVVHDADNLLDDFVFQDLRRKVNGHNKVRNLFSSSNQVVFRHKMARKVEKIRQQFDDVAQDMSNLRLNPVTIIFKQNESSAWRETSSFVLQSEIIGREESKKEIIDLLKQIQANQNVSLIAIVGIGGLGKTALAQLVYNDAEVQNLFEKKMWVCISENFEVKFVVKKMLKSLTDKEVGDLDLEQLQKKLQEELKGKRYMLVLDDVWNESQLEWDDVRTYLMCGGPGSKILVTTHSEIVAHTMGINTPYVLKGLTKEESWALLKNLAFGEDARRMSASLESIGKRIAEKCRGVPLAIRTIGGFLRSKSEESEWSSVLEGDCWGQCKERKSIMPVLKLSYQNLPLELRQCFVYCSLYPKDREIQRGELIQLWMAQGYLECSIETQSMEDVGNQYVKILLMRSFFQDASMSEYNDITSFKMHDLMHDLATSIAGNDCYLDDSEGKGIVGKPMHVSFVSNTICSLNSLDASKLRTFLSPKTQFGFMTKPSVITKLKFLRTLNLSDSSITNLPESIDKFKHLRYLNLSFCYELISLPKSIGNLVSLQSLKLNSCVKLVFCVEVITKLISLRHLDIESCKAFEEMMPAGLGKLTSLRYLSGFVVGEDEKRKSAKLNELKHLNKLRNHLIIRNLGLVKDVVSEPQEANLKAKKYIQRLQLNWGWRKNKNSDSLQLLDNLCPHQNLRELIVVFYPGVRFSSWLSSLTNIVQIHLFGFPNCQHLPPLERFPCLKTLWISEMEELKNMYYEEISPVFFPSLQRLTLMRCEKLKGWQRLLADVNNANDIDTHLALPPFPRLSSLEIMECPNLTCMPTYPHLVDKLKLRSCSVKPMIETCLIQLQSSSSYPLSALKHMEIHNIDIKAMPAEWMRNLTSLKRLSIWGLPIVATVLRHRQQLPVELKELNIFQVDELDLWTDEEDVSTQCQAPHPHALPSLHKISIQFCDNLKALPERIRDLQSLRHITIGFCRNLESLPEAMRCLTNLQTLRISFCPLLSDRCQNESGADWPKIAHIPNIIITP